MIDARGENAALRDEVCKITGAFLVDAKHLVKLADTIEGFDKNALMRLRETILEIHELLLMTVDGVATIVMLDHSLCDAMARFEPPSHSSTGH